MTKQNDFEEVTFWFTNDTALQRHPSVSMGYKLKQKKKAMPEIAITNSLPINSLFNRFFPSAN